MAPADATSGRNPEPTIIARPPVRRGYRVFFFYSSAVVLTGFVAWLFADLMWRTGWSISKSILLVLFTILFLLCAIGCMNAIFGFFIRAIGDKSRLTQLNDYRSHDIKGISTAIVFPIYNEDVARVYERLRAAYRSLQKAGEIEHFDFYILSDSTNPDKWVEEEKRWLELARDLDALGKIYYRRRINNEGKKSGNIHDFLTNWGRRYRYFIVFDADSIMRGATILDMVRLMEVNPEVGLIQTVPALVNAESLFGRIQQFSNRIYAPIFISGLNYWSQNFGNYWGHNAIIRTEPFIQYCDLPHLPGRKPFGGQILSHDFVEAALMLKENWQIWFAYDLEGSYEEAPQDMIENAQRDRRWCQGNMQHALVVFAKGLRGVSRIHLLMGIFGYLSSPLWLLFLLTFNFILFARESSGLSDITVHAFTPFLKVDGTQHAYLIFVICMSVIFLPKVLALIDLARDKQRALAFGGLRHATASAIAETIFSSLQAPLQMLWHSKFVATILFGIGVNWGTQNRDSDGISWVHAVRNHWSHTAIGLVWGYAVWKLDQPTFWWFAPVCAGMVLSIPLSVFTSRASWGDRARKSGLFLTPEEILPPPEIKRLRERMKALDESGSGEPFASGSGLAIAVIDPYVNAIHVSLQREKWLNPEYAEALAQLGVARPEVREYGEKLLAEGPDALKPAERMLVLADSRVMSWLHHQVWQRPNESLAPWWQKAIRKYARN
ncbi:MAG: glycosyl transferase family 2 [Verrucomicrobia bacterium]|jgi:membrane glycosyltransferase|nr:glycosyl transferase family 2 [Verrucomicrobiota bacterium]